MKRLAFPRPKECEDIAALLQSHCLHIVGVDLHVLAIRAALGAILQRYQSRSVNRDIHIDSARIECLPEHQQSLAMRVWLAITRARWESHISGESQIADRLLPQIVEIVDAI